MGIKLKYIISLACVILICGWVAAYSGQREAGDSQQPCIQKTEQSNTSETAAPDFTLKDINGEEFQLSKHKGEIIVLEWTNYDCPFVKAHYSSETKTMSKLAEKYADKGVIWVTINSTYYATVETNKEWAQKNQLKHPLLIDSDGKVGKLYNAKTTPHMFVINKKGNIVYNGAIDNAPMGKKPTEGYVNYVDKALTELLDGKAVSTPKTKPYGCSVKYPKK